MLRERDISAAVWSCWAIIMLALIYIFVSFLEADRAPPVQLTRGTMFIIRGRIEEYVRAHHQLPARLADLPKITPRDFYKDALDDGWGNPIQYEVQANGTVLLVSHGLNGKDSISLSFNVPKIENVAE